MDEQARKMIGGSDAAAIAGVHPYKTALDVWRRIIEGHNPDNAAMRRGRMLEPVIRQMYADETGATVRGPAFMTHPKMTWARASLDDVAERDGAPRVAEYKSANWRMANTYGEGSDDVPMEHVCQVNWYMAFTGYELADLAVLLGGDELRVYTLHSDKELQDMLFAASERFWIDHVVARKPPQIDGSDSCTEWLKAKYSRGGGELLTATEEVDELAHDLMSAQYEAKRSDERAESLRNQLRAIIGDADGIQGQGWSVTWRKNKDGQRVDWESLSKTLPPELIAKHTVVKPGPRVFRCNFKKGKDNASSSSATAAT